MLKRKTHLISFVACLVAMPAMAQTSVLDKLFTTQQERQLINSNRYKNDNTAPTISAPVTLEVEAVQELVREEVEMTYHVSGISVVQDGLNTAWINGQPYENGAMIDGDAKLRINNGSIKTVTIITPDGAKHSGTTGETLSVTYSKAVER